MMFIIYQEMIQEKGKGSKKKKEKKTGNMSAMLSIKPAGIFTPFVY